MSDGQGQISILLVDDDWMNVEVIEAFLQMSGYNVSTAHNGKTALEKVQQVHPDLILLDVKMPDMTGFEVCQRIKSNEQTRSSLILMVTALESKEDRQQAVNVGADGFITKPFKPVMLLEQIKAMLDKTQT